MSAFFQTRERPPVDTLRTPEKLIKITWDQIRRGFSLTLSSALQCRRSGFDPWVRKIPWRRKWQPSLVFLPGESHGQRSLVGYSPQGGKESNTTEQLHFHFTFIFTHPNLFSNPTLDILLWNSSLNPSELRYIVFLRQESTVAPFTWQAIKLSFSTSPKFCLKDSIQHQCREAKLSTLLTPCTIQICKYRVVCHRDCLQDKKRNVIF